MLRLRSRRLQLEGYALLLVLLLLFVAVQTADDPALRTSLVPLVLRIVIGASILLLVFTEKRPRLVMGGLLALTLGIGALEANATGPTARTLGILFHVVDGAFMLATLVWILRRVLRSRSTGGADVLGAICGYLMAGEAIASINALAYVLLPQAFSVSVDQLPLLGSLHTRMSAFAYYSFTQLLTLGDADITPVHAPATTLSLFAALFGLFYTAIVVAQFVGMERGAAGAEPRRKDGDQGAGTT